jgi:hypothetical protein
MCDLSGLRRIKQKKEMTTLLRFKPVEVSSAVRFSGKTTIVLTYTVLSLSLVPYPVKHAFFPSSFTVPEIFW